jgi:hypothetical protein
MDKKRHIKLSWDLIGYKLYYYHPEKVHKSWHKYLDISDGDYDELEREYLRLCLKLGVDNTVAGQTEVDGKRVSGEGMQEIDFDRPSCQSALKKHSNRMRRRK